MDSGMNKHAEPAHHFIASSLATPADSRHRKTFDAVSADHDVSRRSGNAKTFYRPGS
jgi:hypothetical protein